MVGSWELVSWELDNSPGLDHPALGHHDDAAADVVPIAIGVLDALFVDQTCAVANARVLVDDHAIEHDVLPDPERRLSLRRRTVFVEVGAEQHRP